VTEGCPELAEAVSGVSGATVSRSPSRVRSSIRQSLLSAMTNKSPAVLFGRPLRFGAWLMILDPVPMTAKLEQLRMTRVLESTW
jgi:hypothetical protein